MKLCSLFSFGLCYANNDLHTDGVLDLEGADFANMERKDQEKLLGKIFAKMDTSKNGLVDREEMLAWAWIIEKKYMLQDVENWVSEYSSRTQN